MIPRRSGDEVANPEAAAVPSRCTRRAARSLVHRRLPSFASWNARSEGLALAGRHGAAILSCVASRTPHLAATSEILFFATMLLVPGVIALYRSLASVDRAKAATGCGIIAVVVPVIAMLLIVHGCLVYPVFGLRASTPGAVELVVAIFYGGLHAVYLLMAFATFILSLAMRRSAFGARIAYLGYATSLLDVAGGYPDAIGPIPTLVCRAVFSAWFMAVGWKLDRLGWRPSLDLHRDEREATMPRVLTKQESGHGREAGS